MKDLTFIDQSVRVTFRTDLIGNTGAFTVYSITGLTPQNLSNSFHQKLMEGFKKIQYDVQTFKAFAQLRGLGLTIADSNGSNSSVLVVENAGASSF